MSVAEERPAVLTGDQQWTVSAATSSLGLVFAKVVQCLEKVKSMQRSGIEAIRTQIQPSKPNREIPKITKNQNTKRTYGQPSEQLFSKR